MVRVRKKIGDRKSVPRKKYCERRCYEIRRLRRPAKPSRPLTSRTEVTGSGAETVPVPRTWAPFGMPSNSREKMPPTQVSLSSLLLSLGAFRGKKRRQRKPGTIGVQKSGLGRVK